MATEYVIPGAVMDQVVSAVPLADIVAAVGAEHSWDATSLIQKAVEAAAPLILAAELDSLAELFASASADKEARFEARQAEVTAVDAEWDDDPRCQNLAGYASAYGNVARRLRSRASEFRAEASDG
jgi:hypothetical protein